VALAFTGSWLVSRRLSRNIQKASPAIIASPTTGPTTAPTIHNFDFAGAGVAECIGVGVDDDVVVVLDVGVAVVDTGELR
jgi:hypothetical protein